MLFRPAILLLSLLLPSLPTLAQTTPAPPTTTSATAPSGLIKTGTGTLTLTSGGGYTGTTNVLPGKLVVTPKGVSEDPAFGTMPDGTPVKLFTLANAKGMQARICTYGATIDGVKIPDAQGTFTNVCACADTFQTLQHFNMQAQTIGRFANRIAGGKFTLDGKDYTTQLNSGPNTLHSGNANFGGKVWQGKALPPKDHESSAELTYVSKDGDGGFPGNLTLTLTFTLTDDNEVKLEYQATTDKPTPINMTNHAYWNLAGAPGWGNPTATPAGTQELWIDADNILASDANHVPTGILTPVKGTPFDFTTPTAVGTRVPQLAPERLYDHAFVLNATSAGTPGKIAPAARLRDPASGRQMEIRTDQPGIMLYTGQRLGIALETHHHPDSLHHDNFPTTILRPGQTFKTTTIYAFSNK